ncbi:ATP-dependent DNA ligase [Nakamurella sp. YIM 132087]|uniref:ATP-dependent DNA ligase n=1 Tax=Nakamurella alba TaxID=2665158 RepID=A0A7K1FKC3_9ACTN|nr:DNA polymerase domain-containing protein [Nakamurella alba]MTD14558.1 ATP-dependent DNA ligase [Nakamurella alba]
MSPSRTPAVEIDVAGRPVRVTSPDRVMFAGPGLTKLDLVQYFVSVGDGILGALKDRPTTLERWPKGWFEGATLSTRMDNQGDAFYSKRVPKGAPDWVENVTITFPSGRTAEEVCPTELAVVAWASNLGTLRFHPWPVRRPETEQPDQLRVDLDPQPGTDFRDTVPVAAELRNLLSELGLEGHPKTSGGRGLHVYIPIAPRWSFVDARHAVIALGRALERRMPDQVTTAWWKEERGERIFIDFNQMARDRTIASAYSIRPNARATVSAPLRWDEIPDVTPEDFDVTTMPARFAEVGDLHAAVAQQAFDLDPLLELWEKDLADRGLGEMPYPPDYPKMPGEPPRVQPSKKNPANWTDE